MPSDDPDARGLGAERACTTTGPTRNPAVVRRPQQGGWAVLVNLDSVRSVALNPTADLVWRALDGRHDVRQVVGLIRASFDEVPASAEQDVTDLLEELARSGFVGYDIAGAAADADS